MEIEKDIVIQASSNGKKTLLTLNPFPITEKLPTQICCVIDTSYSMDDEASIKSDTGTENYGLTILDLTKHALRTIIKSLKEEDSLCLVTFSDRGHVKLKPHSMDKKGKQLALNIVDDLYTDGSTNLWDGIKIGIDLLAEEKNIYNSSLFVLTDGCPNVDPPRGYIPTLQKYKEKKKIPTINTFGFGNNLDSKLLYEIAFEANGTYAFIPDGSFVGTIFVNALSNSLSTIASNVSVTLEGVSTFSDDLYLSGFKWEKVDDHLTFSLGIMTSDQSKSLIIPDSLDCLKLKISFETPFEEDVISILKTVKVEKDSKSMVEIEDLRMISGCRILQNALKRKSKDFKDVLYLIENSNCKDEKYVIDLQKDLEDQATLASSDKYYNKWGLHYLLSLGRTHILQQCNNFKDPGVQHYGGKNFNDFRDEIDEIFLDIPPPKPSRVSSNTTTVSNMSVYYNSSGPCFEGSSSVKMFNGNHKFVKDIKKDDQILGVSGKGVKVVCVLKTRCNNEKRNLVDFNGLKITPWHPVKIKDEFYFPESLGEIKEYDCDFVYSFVLECEHLMIINDTKCVTLGHGFQDNIAKHDFFGSEKVINELKQFQGWNEEMKKVL
eukprot:gene7363-11685_t